MAENGSPVELRELIPDLNNLQKVEGWDRDYSVRKSQERVPKEDASRGVYSTLQEALGVDPSYFATREWAPIDKFSSEGEYTQWDKALTLFTEPTPLERPRFTSYFEKKLIDGRKVYMVGSLIKHDKASDGKSMVPVFRIDNLVISGKDKFVNFIDRIPEGTTVYMRPEKTVRNEDDIISNTDSLYYNIATKEINFRGFDSILDVAGVWHEGGHAVEWSLLTDEEKDEEKRAIRVIHSLGSKQWEEFDQVTVDKIEDENTMDLLSARQIRANHERFASLWAIDDLTEIQDPLAIDPETANIICENYELYWRSYDQFFYPEAAASELGRGVPEADGEHIYEMIQLFDDIVAGLKELGVTRDQDLTVPSLGKGDYKLSRSNPGVVYVAFIPTDSKDPYYITSLKPREASLSKYANRLAFRSKQAEDTVVNTFTPELFTKTLKDMPYALGFFSEVKKHLDDYKGELVREKFGFLQETLGKYYPELLIHDSTGVEGKNSPEEIEKFAKLLYSRIGQDIGFDTTGYNFDIAGGIPITNEWDRLVNICQGLLTSEKAKGVLELINYDVPDKFKDINHKIEIEKQIVKKAAEYSVTLKAKLDLEKARLRNEKALGVLDVLRESVHIYSPDTVLSDLLGDNSKIPTHEMDILAKYLYMQIGKDTGQSFIEKDNFNAITGDTITDEYDMLVSVCELIVQSAGLDFKRYDEPEKKSEDDKKIITKAIEFLATQKEKSRV